MDPYIQVSDLSVTYLAADGREVHALDHIELDVREGEFLTLIGPSGCGKSTLLNVIGGLVAPSSGRVSIGDGTPRRLREAKQIGYMFQRSVLLDWRTIRENISFLAELARKDLPETEVSELARTLGIGDFLDSYPHELSGGMQQRAALGRTLALKPKVLLMDEPFGALDEITRERLNFELLRVWASQKKTVVFVTHSISEAVFLSDRVIVLSARPGRISSEIKVDLPRPRTEDDLYGPRMNDLVAHLHARLRAAEHESSQDEPQPSAGGMK